MVKHSIIRCLFSATKSVHIPGTCVVSAELKRLHLTSAHLDNCPVQDCHNEDISASSDSGVDTSSEITDPIMAKTSEADLEWSSDEDDGMESGPIPAFYNDAASKDKLTLGRKSQPMRFYPSYLLKQKAEVNFSLPRTHYPLRRRSTRHKKKRSHPAKTKKTSDIKQPRPDVHQDLMQVVSGHGLRKSSLNKSLDTCLDIEAQAEMPSLGSLVHDWWGKDSPKPRRRMGTIQKPHVTDDHGPPVFCDEEDCPLPGCHGSAENLDKPTRVSQLKKFGRLGKGYSWCDIYSGTGSCCPTLKPSLFCCLSAVCSWRSH